MTSQDNRYTLTMSCESSPGIVAAVSSYLADHDCNIIESSQFDDQNSGRFFMRIHFSLLDQLKCSIEDLQQGFNKVTDRFQMQWEIQDVKRPTKVLIMVSKFDHCLTDLLYRYNKGELDMEITAVVSNHLDLRPMVEREGIRYVYLPVNKDNKLEQEQNLLEIFNESGSQLVVLARYMQVLSDQLCQQLKGRAINIHHSFLPGFKGAKPYHQAFDRGVKLIGATAHYVTADLDEGPIISQSVQQVDHSLYADDLVSVGRDTETKALAHAVKLHINRRVFLDGNKTVILK